MKFIIDLDGTLLNGAQPINRAGDFIAQLHRRQLDFVVMTNSILAPAVQAERLRQAGLAVPAELILNPISVLRQLVHQRQFSRVWLVGSAAEQAQFDLVSDDQQPEAVFLLDFEKANVDYQTLQRLLTALHQGVPVWAASGSAFYFKAGIRTLDTGAFVGLLEAASGRSITIAGKPSPVYFQAAVDRLGGPTADVVVIGDDPATDIVGGRSLGLSTCLVKTGKYRPGDEVDAQPTWCTDNLLDLLPPV